MIFAISDHHFFHERITNGELDLNRGFATVDDMHNHIIDSHNKVVGHNDIVWFLGDLTLERPPKPLQFAETEHSSAYWRWTRRQVQLREMLNAMNGRKGKLFLGNHDHLPVQEYLWLGFERISATEKLNKFLFSHVPIHPSQFYRFRGNVHGHTHDKMVKLFEGDALDRNDPRFLNVSVEAVNYTPMSLDEIDAEFTRRGL